MEAAQGELAYIVVPNPQSDPSNPTDVQTLTFEVSNTVEGDGEEQITRCGAKTTAKNGHGSYLFHYTSLARYGYDGRQIEWAEGYTGHGVSSNGDWTFHADTETTEMFPPGMPATAASWDAEAGFSSWYAYAEP
ncbi:MAG TPA: hypothetical protein VND68_07875, partial [Chloroflexia bacterium]|nr:hypothetical protein [Chloroflexia bacterium]